MKYIKFLLIGILFGIIMTKSEAISWYRIQEMFRFQSFHMYGIIGSTVVLGMIMIQLIKYKQLRSIGGKKIQFQPKEKGVKRYLLGGIIFGFGWVLTGSCPGPMITLVGKRFSIILVSIACAILGTYTYGYYKDKLPH